MKFSHFIAIFCVKNTGMFKFIHSAQNCIIELGRMVHIHKAKSVVYEL